MKKLGKIIIPILLIFAVILAIANNPSIDDFSNWCVQEIAGESPVGRALGALASTALSSALMQNVIQSFVSQKNYLLFSIFEVGEVRVLGVFNRFYNISEFYK